MRKITQIEVEELAIHILDHHSHVGLVLSEATIFTSQRKSLSDYICNHILNSLKDESSKAAKFVPSQVDNFISQIANDLLENRIDLLSSSRQIAQKLYDIIKNDNRISSGVLVICLFKDLEDNRQNYLAILKLDGGVVFKPETITDEKGRQVIDFQKIPNTLPSENEKLQKCAFIRSSDSSNNYDLIILDRQTKNTEGVSRFFAKDFLSVELAYDSKTRTKELYKGLIEAQNQLRHELTAKENSRLSEATRYVMSTEIVDIDNFIEAMAIPEKPKKVLDQIVRKFVPDRKFEIDLEVGRKMTSKKKFRGEQGFRLEINASDYNEVVESVKQIEQGNLSYSRIVLKVRNLIEK